MKMHQISDQDDLLNINQAAEFLQVSPVSLRRWTDAGRLKCFRIGGRRERRFRRRDLRAFLDARAQAPAESAATRAPSGPTMMGMEVAYGTHLCSLYESDQGRLKMAVPFLAEGLQRRDVCYLVASVGTVEAITTSLRDVGVDVDRALAQRWLRITTGADSAAAIYHYFEAELFQATLSGEHAVRVLGDMAWFLDRGLTVDDLIDFELRYNHNLAHQYPVISLCQFDARRFDGTGILSALKCHEDTFSYPFTRFMSTRKRVLSPRSEKRTAVAAD